MESWELLNRGIPHLCEVSGEDSGEEQQHGCSGGKQRHQVSVNAEVQR